jgi:uracil-DNA glycosylase family 4
LSQQGPREELARLAEELRVHVEWQVETGATGVPRREEMAKDARQVVVRGAAARGTAEHLATSEANVGTGTSASIGTRTGTSTSRADAKVRLVTLAEEIKSCTKCALHSGRTQTVFARGNPMAELCFVGEGPGADEDAQGFPFVGKAGQLLDRMIAAMGFERDDVYVCNIVKCRPPDNRKPQPDEMATCVPYLREQLDLVAPKVIVALGATAVEGLIGMSGGITRLRGQWKLYRTIPTMPTFHPAYLLRNPAAKKEVWADLQAVLKQLGRPVPPAGRSA